MAETRVRRTANPTRPAASSGKVAITLRLDAGRVRQLQAMAEADNRTLTNYVETALIRDLAAHDEASRIITLYAAPGTSERIAPEDILRGKGETETDEAFSKRCELLTELWSIPDNG